MALALSETRLHKLVQLLLGPLPVPGVLPRHVVAVEERVGVLVQHGTRKLLGGLALGATPAELAPAARLPSVLGQVHSGGRGDTSVGCPHVPDHTAGAHRRAGGQAQLRAHALLHPACEVPVHEWAWQAGGTTATEWGQRGRSAGHSLCCLFHLWAGPCALGTRPPSAGGRTRLCPQAQACGAARLRRGLPAPPGGPAPYANAAACSPAPGAAQQQQQTPPRRLRACGALSVRLARRRAPGAGRARRLRPPAAPPVLPASHCCAGCGRRAPPRTRLTMRRRAGQPPPG